MRIVHNLAELKTIAEKSVVTIGNLLFAICFARYAAAAWGIA